MADAVRPPHATPGGAARCERELAGIIELTELHLGDHFTVQLVADGDDFVCHRIRALEDAAPARGQPETFSSRRRKRTKTSRRAELGVEHAISQTAHVSGACRSGVRGARPGDPSARVFDVLPSDELAVAREPLPSRRRGPIERGHFLPQLPQRFGRIEAELVRRVDGERVLQ